jgi:maltose alpha-D-glucosyltransferase/alpha-amylase
VIYQVHVKAYSDSTGDGIGDFDGLASRLDYLVSLGVTAIWLLPFYPSPLRDDGYDIANYRDVNPNYGTIRAFKRFTREAHKRGLKVITELVINHTSDQHPWFQRARHAKPGSAARNFYVWSDDDKKWADTRIIFCDTEPSNWTWDPVAGQYYWHRFFSHQPDLNYENPQVIEEVLKVMKFWLELGVDGMRLDAIPYLVARDGTSNENLPETHAVIKQLRAWMDEHYPGRMLLGEANQWPEDVLPYFGEGEGDECNMAFHFPLMPRMYMALAREDRHPITDIMRQTPDIPATAQWAVFLRNHDELTLEMVTDQERDYLWNYYASDPRARINLGIRRRLAPLVDNDRRKIELLNSLLMSMPGTPIVYYGDEIGMGDNIYLGDRDGVRTPMQWSMDRNGGFSSADPQRLYLPAIQDALYGYQALNVEAQHASLSSLLNWMRRIIAVRKAHKAFGRGSLRFLYPGNRKVLAYLRHLDGEVPETILCVSNLSRAAQPVELDLADFAGRVPVELMGSSAFPTIGDLPYFITLPAYGFYWFRLADPAAEGEAGQAPQWHEPWVPHQPEFITLVMNADWSGLTSGRGLEALCSQALPEFLPLQRWFPGRHRRLKSVEPVLQVPLTDPKTANIPGPAPALQSGVSPPGWLLGVYRAAMAPPRHGQAKDDDGLLPRDNPDQQVYFVPLAVTWGERKGSAHGENPNGPPNAPEDPLPLLASLAITRARRGPRLGVVHDASTDSGFARSLTQAILQGGRIGDQEPPQGPLIRFYPTEAARGLSLADDAEVTRLGADQTNTSLRLGEDLVLKLYRRLESGLHPEVESAQYLTDQTRYSHTPPLYGYATVQEDPNGPEFTIAVVQGFVRNQGDGWAFTVDYLDRRLEQVLVDAPEPAHASPQADQAAQSHPHSFFFSLAQTLGLRLGELHTALAHPSANAAFAPQAADQETLDGWQDGLRKVAKTAKRALKDLLREDSTSPQAQAAQQVLEDWDQVKATLGSLLKDLPPMLCTRIHGDLHLGQVVLVQDDFHLLDFEGEPARPILNRRTKTTPLKDVAGMMRSFDYASWTAYYRRVPYAPHAADALRADLESWQDGTLKAFLEGYQQGLATREENGLPPILPDDPAQLDAALRLFMLEKALYEVAYEAAHRPDWLHIPLRGVMAAVGLVPGPWSALTTSASGDPPRASRLL